MTQRIGNPPPVSPNSFIPLNGWPENPNGPQNPTLDDSQLAPSLDNSLLDPSLFADRSGINDPGDLDEVNLSQEVDDVVKNGEGPDLQPGDGQGVHFAANHNVSSGRDWDLNTAEGMRGTVQEAVHALKTMVAGAEPLNALDVEVSEKVANACNLHPTEDAAGLAQSYAEFKMVLHELQQARASLTDAVKDGSEPKNDPREALAGVRKTLRVFRYELQKELGKLGDQAGEMDFFESGLRGIQHAFSFRVGSKVHETFAKIVDLEAQLSAKLNEINDHLQEMDSAATPIEIKSEALLAGVTDNVLELSHRTNDQIRNFQEVDATSSTLRGIVGPMAEKGGSRKVEFNVGVGALIGLGFSSALTAGLRAGARIRVVGDIQAQGKGRGISVTFRIAGGLEAKAQIEAGKESEVAGAKANASAGAEISHFTTRTYQTVDDLILDAKRCKLATSRTIGLAIWGGIKSLGCSIGRLGTKFFQWLGRKNGDIRQDNAQYLQTLKSRGIAHETDRLLAKRSNPIIVAERKGWIGRFNGEAGGSISLGPGIASLGLNVNAAHEREFKVSSESFAPVARMIKSAKDTEALNDLMRPAPEGESAGPVPHYTGMNAEAVQASLENEYDAEIQKAEEQPPANQTEWATLANKIRTLMLATELAARNNSIPREQADRLLVRFSNPSIKFPPDIFREYFMEGTGAAKPAKIRNSFTTKLKVSLLSGKTDELTNGIGNSIAKAVAKGGVTAMRKEVGLDTTFQYRFSSEKPSKPGADIRPWENAVKTTHELAISGSMPTRIIIDTISRTIINNGERVENKSDHIAKDTAKDLAKDIGLDVTKTTLAATLPGLILAGVKEAAIYGVKKWLSDPENLLKLIEFAVDHLGDALEFLTDTVVWVVEHPELTLQIAGSIMGTSSLGESERYKTVKWDFMDGQLETVTVSHESISKMGVNVDPVGVGVGIGFDISYSVTESIKDRDYTPRPSLTALLGKTAEFMLGETGLNSAGSGQPLKNWLSRNAKGVEYALTNLLSEKNMEKNLQIYYKAQELASRDTELLERLQNAWDTVNSLPEDATLDAKVDAAHELLVTLVLAYQPQDEVA